MACPIRPVIRVELIRVAGAYIGIGTYVAIHTFYLIYVAIYVRVLDT